MNTDEMIVLLDTINTNVWGIKALSLVE